MDLPNFDAVEAALRQNDLPVRDLYSIWEKRQPVADPLSRKTGETTDATQHIAWLQEDPSLAHRFTAHALEKEEFLLVCDAAEEALRFWPDARPDMRAELVRVRMDYAAALARLGSTLKARALLEPCVSDDFEIQLVRKRKVDILIQLGNILREDSHQAATKAERRHKAEEALRFYQQALQLEPDRLEALVLTAAASLVLGEPGSALRQQAQDQAQQALRLIARIEDDQGAQPRTIITRAVAHAVRGETDRAAKAYEELKGREDVSVAQHANARYYARSLAEALGHSRDFFDEAFPALQLIVFAGHLPDRPDGNRVHFPRAIVDTVRERLAAQLKKMQARVGLVNAAAGGDLLFIEALLNQRPAGTVHLLLPWSSKEYRRTSVCPYDPPNGPAFWEPLFDRALQKAATLREISQPYEPSSEVGWQYTMEVTAGLALHTARISRLDVQPLVLWDGRAGAGTGGTSSFEEFWRCKLGHKPIVVDLPSLPETVYYAGRFERGQRSERSTLHPEVKSMLFADIVGYSKLTERVLPKFVEVFLEKVSQLIASSKYAPRHVNTWGDAVYAVFDYAHNAGCFALELTQMIQENQKLWLSSGLYWEEQIPGQPEPKKHPLNIRIGLHTGPVFMHFNPVVRQLGFTGVHVNRAARIEPIAAHGEVYASEEFTSLAALGHEILLHENRASGTPEDNTGFLCEYTGSKPLAKGYPGRFRLYRVLPKRVFALEELAHAIHELYCIEAAVNGDTPETNSALVPWERLTDEGREANMAQAGDIPNKLRALGYELAPGYGLSPDEIQISDEQLETMAIREHDRWSEDRKRQGWTYAPKRDNSRLHHPLLVPWDQLNEREKQKDRDAVRNLPKLITTAKFRVRKIAGAK